MITHSRRPKPQPARKRAVKRVRPSSALDRLIGPGTGRQEIDIDEFIAAVEADATPAERAEMDKLTQALIDAIDAARARPDYSTDEGDLPEEPLLPSRVGGTLAVFVPPQRLAATERNGRDASPRAETADHEQRRLHAVLVTEAFPLNRSDAVTISHKKERESKPSKKYAVRRRKRH